MRFLREPRFPNTPSLALGFKEGSEGNMVSRRGQRGTWVPLIY
jgi:hypothetical protein